jgi:hypothetical protein
MGILGSKYGLLVRICGSVDSAKDLVVIPDEIEEESDSDKEQDAENEVIYFSRSQRLVNYMVQNDTDFLGRFPSVVAY